MVLLHCVLFFFSSRKAVSMLIYFRGYPLTNGLESSRPAQGGANGDAGVDASRSPEAYRRPHSEHCSNPEGSGVRTDVSASPC